MIYVSEHLSESARAQLERLFNTRGIRVTKDFQRATAAVLNWPQDERKVLQVRGEVLVVSEQKPGFEDRDLPRAPEGRFWQDAHRGDSLPATFSRVRKLKVKKPDRVPWPYPDYTRFSWDATSWVKVRQLAQLPAEVRKRTFIDPELNPHLEHYLGHRKRKLKAGRREGVSPPVSVVNEASLLSVEEWEALRSSSPGSLSFLVENEEWLTADEAIARCPSNASFKVSMRGWEVPWAPLKYLWWLVNDRTIKKRHYFEWSKHDLHYEYPTKLGYFKIEKEVPRWLELKCWVAEEDYDRATHGRVLQVWVSPRTGKKRLNVVVGVECEPEHKNYWVPSFPVQNEFYRNVQWYLKWVGYEPLGKDDNRDPIKEEPEGFPVCEDVESREFVPMGYWTDRNVQIQGMIEVREGLRVPRYVNKFVDSGTSRPLGKWGASALLKYEVKESRPSNDDDPTPDSMTLGLIEAYRNRGRVRDNWTDYGRLDLSDYRPRKPPRDLEAAWKEAWRVLCGLDALRESILFHLSKPQGPDEEDNRDRLHWELAGWVRRTELILDWFAEDAKILTRIFKRLEWCDGNVRKHRKRKQNTNLRVRYHSVTRVERPGTEPETVWEISRAIMEELRTLQRSLNSRLANWDEENQEKETLQALENLRTSGGVVKNWKFQQEAGALISECDRLVARRLQQLRWMRQTEGAMA